VAHDRIAVCLGYLHVKADPHHCDPKFCRGAQLVIEKCGVLHSAAVMSAFNGSHVALSQHLNFLQFMTIYCSIGGTE